MLIKRLPHASSPIGCRYISHKYSRLTPRNLAQPQPRQLVLLKLFLLLLLVSSATANRPDAQPDGRPCQGTLHQVAAWLQTAASASHAEPSDTRTEIREKQNETHQEAANKRHEHERRPSSQRHGSSNLVKLEQPSGQSLSPASAELCGRQPEAEPAGPIQDQASLSRPPRWAQRAQQGQPEPVLVRGLIGNSVAVPCGAAPATPSAKAHPGHASAPGQPISLVSWYKDANLDAPIFTLDARLAGSMKEARPRTGSPALEGRARPLLSGSASQSAPSLLIEQARAQDGGLYTCVLEFHKMPTQTHQVRLQLVRAPSDLRIQDQAGRALPFGLIGPYDEHSSLVLSCSVKTGDQDSELSWWRLRATSVLPLTRQRLGPPLGSEPSPSEQLITMTLANQPDANYLVALQGAGQEPANLVLPFANGLRLKHWTRVQVPMSSFAGFLNSSLDFANLQRANLHDEYICLARTTDSFAPLNGSVRIDLNLKPIGVHIRDKANHVFRLNQKSIVECQVHGSKPSPEINWTRGSTALDFSQRKGQSLENELGPKFSSEFHRDISGNNLTKISYLTIIPQLSDNQQYLTCSAFNPALANSQPISDSLLMDVQYPARFELQFGSRIKLDSIRLGSDIFMDCLIQSNPAIHDISWLFNDQPLIPDNSAGIIMSNLSLVLQGIRIQHRGSYQCYGQNSMGKFYSNKLNLNPKFEPICDYSLTKTKYEIPFNQAAKIECNILAEPIDEITFEWKFNQSSVDSRYEDSTNSNQLVDIKDFVVNSTKSYATFTPTSRSSHGQLLCSASNSIGKQERPCFIQIIVSELPEPVFGCFFDNLTNSSFSIHCQSNEASASSRHNYLLELHTQTDESLSNLTPENSSTQSVDSTANNQRQSYQMAYNSGLMDDEQSSSGYVKMLSNNTPTFHVYDLKPSTDYNAMIYAQNSKGRSSPAFFQTKTLPTAKVLPSMMYGQIQFNNRRLTEDTSFTSKMTSILKLGDHLDQRSFRFILILTSIIMLCTILVVASLVFGFKLCRSARPKSRECQMKELPGTNEKPSKLLNPAGSSRDGPSQSATGTTSDPIERKPGSGSDTSRETNTDSTLISSSRAGQELHGSLLRQNENAQNGCFDRASSQCGRRRVHPFRDIALDPGYSFMNLLPPKNVSTGHNERCIPIAYGPVRCANLTSPQDFEHPNTPQVSIQSGSDCTSNNELPPDGWIPCNSEISEPVYVIGSDNRQDPRQVRLINTTGFCTHSDPIYYGNRVIHATDRLMNDRYDEKTPSFSNPSAQGSLVNNNCQMMNAPGLIGVLPPPANFMTNSASVSFALSDCPQPITQQSGTLTRKFPSDNLCLDNNNRGSHQTLAPSNNYV